MNDQKNNKHWLINKPKCNVNPLFDVKQSNNSFPRISSQKPIILRPNIPSVPQNLQACLSAQ